MLTRISVTCSEEFKLERPNFMWNIKTDKGEFYFFVIRRSSALVVEFVAETPIV